MAKKVVEQEGTETQESGTVPKKRKYKLKGLLVWGSVVYSDSDNAFFPMTDEIAEELLRVKPELIQLFDVQDV